MRSIRSRVADLVGVLIVPTGLGAAIGGHAGDATPVAKLLAACCDWLIVHPNVVNASDINEMPANALYVDGYTLDQVMAGKEGLERCRRQNSILVVVNSPLDGATANAISAACTTFGAEIQLVELNTPLRMTASIANDGSATGLVSGVDELVDQLSLLRYDTLAIHTPIACSTDMETHYWSNGGVNPWGGVEAKASRMISKRIRKPVAHAPLDIEDKPEFRHLYRQSVDPRMAAEAISNCFLNCVLKGLHDCPLPTSYLPAADWTGQSIDFIVAPRDVYPGNAVPAIRCGAKLIQVIENETILDKQPGMPSGIFAANYLEAAGLVACMRAGVTPRSVRSTDCQGHEHG